MYPTPLIFLGSVLILSGCQSGVKRADIGADTGQVQVHFENAERFTDVSDSYKGETDTGYLDSLRRYMVDQAGRYLSPGQTLAMTFRDIDMAGDFEPWRGPDAMNVRIVKSIYPPRVEFDYVVTDAEGEIVSKGNERLTDLAFEWRLLPTLRHDPLAREKELLRDWVDRTLQ